MAHLMYFSCGACKGCPAVPLRFDQHLSIMEQLSTDDIAREYLDMDVGVVFCDKVDSIAVCPFKRRQSYDGII